MMLLLYPILGCSRHLEPAQPTVNASTEVVLLEAMEFWESVPPISPIPHCAGSDVFAVDGASSSVTRIDGTLEHALTFWQLPKGGLIAGARLISEQKLVVFEYHWGAGWPFAVRILDMETSTLRTVRLPELLENRLLNDWGVQYLDIGVQPDGTVIQKCGEQICALSPEGTDWQRVEAPKNVVISHAMSPTELGSREIALVRSTDGSLRVTHGSVDCAPSLLEARAWSGPSGQYLVVAGGMDCDGERVHRVELYDTSTNPWSSLLSAPLREFDFIQDLGFIWDPATSRPSGAWLTWVDPRSDVERLDLVQLGSTQVTELSGLLPDDPTRMWVGGLCGTRAGVRVVGGVGSLVYSAELTSRGLRPRGLEIYRGPGGVATLQADQALRRAQRARGTHIVGQDP